jgi:RNA polymerase sigma factor (sigma-70 family)
MYSGFAAFSALSFNDQLVDLSKAEVIMLELRSEAAFIVKESYVLREGKMKKGLSWQDLVAQLVQAKQGDGQAVDRLFNFLQSRLLVIARYRVPGSAEDLVQETLVIVHNRLSEFESLEGLLAFTNQVLRNKIGNTYQERDRRKHRHAELEENLPLQYNIDVEIYAIELDQIVRECIDRLGERHPNCRAILSSLYHGFNPDEISRRLGITKSSLKVQVFRCRKALRKILSEEYRLEV